MTDKLNINVERALPEDAGTIAQFNQAMALETEDKPLDREMIFPGVQALLADDSMGFYLVARETTPADETIVGCLAITYEWSDWRNGLFWWIQSVYVPEEHRGKGVFSTMYEHVRTLAKKDPRNCGIRLYVEKDNSRAQRTYAKLGMIETEYRLMEEEF
ncbi:MAG: GNAT family N-acetyltransferase [Pseudomonadales bacterium]|nr:GNAT family N-acetyltransferase [Pseudomonadales bacterium]